MTVKRNEIAEFIGFPEQIIKRWIRKKILQSVDHDDEGNPLFDVNDIYACASGQ